MDYETFKQEMTEDLKQRLYERGIEDVEMSFHNVEKANQHYESLTVRQEGSNVGVNFNIESAFAEYEHTGDYAGVLAESTHAIMQGLENVLLSSDCFRRSDSCGVSRMQGSAA